jgi:hypothetical protein
MAQGGNFQNYFFQNEIFIVRTQEGNSHPIPLPVFGGVGSTPSVFVKVSQGETLISNFTEDGCFLSSTNAL